LKEIKVFLKNFKIGTRLGISFGIMIVLSVIVSIFSIQEMKSLSSLTTKLFKHPYTVSTAMLRIDNNINMIHIAMKNFRLAENSKNEKKMAAALSSVDGFEDAVYKDFDIVAERYLGDKAKVNEAKKLFADWKPIREEVIALRKSGEKEKAAAITSGKGAQHTAALHKAVGDFTEFAQGMAEKFVKNAAADRDQALFMTYIILSVAILLGLLLSFFMTRSITVPLKEAVDVADRMSENDLTATINVTRKDETGRLLASMEQMVENLSTTISANAAAADEVSTAASEQASSLEETSSSLEEMAAMTKQNADNANEANGIVSKSKHDVAQASDTMNQLNTSMEEISKASEETQKIVKTIDEIAFQTNLLALNAAVEAARAGEAGAGFAVVADEVRNLAIRAADAAKNTAGLIEGTVKKVKDGSELVTETNKAFAEVVNGTAKVGELVSEITASSSEQAEGIEQLNQAVTEMDKAVQQNAATSEEMASSMAMFKVRGGATKSYSHHEPQVESFEISKQPKLGKLAEKNYEGVRPEQVIPMDEDDFKDF
jgi:methyl-accepting chemotaxis protein